MSDTSAPLRALPPDAILLHVGPYKTGTTAMQSVCAHSRAALHAHGVLYPGDGPAQHNEAKALRQYREGWGADAYAAPSPAVWERLVHLVRATPGRVLLSSEYFGDADARDLARLVDDLGRDRLHVIAATRNPAGLAVSTWQQTLRKGRPLTFERWLESTYRRTEILDQPGGFWSRADASALTARFAEVVDPGRITLVVLDDRDRRLLPATFEQLLGLPAGLLADATPRHSNRGLSAAEAALLHRVVVALGSKLTWAEYSKVVRRGVVRRLLVTRTPGPDEPRAVLPGWAVEQARVEAERTVARLRGMGLQIAGDLDMLRVLPVAAGVNDPIDTIPVDLAAEAVVGAIAAGLTGSWDIADRPESEPGVPAARARRAVAGRASASQRVKAQGVKARGVGVQGVEALSGRQIAGVLARRVRTRLRRAFRR